LDESLYDDDYQAFGSSKAHLVFAVPVTELAPAEVVTEFPEVSPQESPEELNEEFNEDFPEDISADELFELGSDQQEVAAEDSAAPELLYDYEEVTSSPDEFDTKGEVGEYEKDNDTFESVITNLDRDVYESTDEPNLEEVTTTLPFESAPLSFEVSSTPMPLHARLNDVSKKTVDVSDKKSMRGAKIIGKSTIREVHSSDPVVCFKNGKCIKVRGFRKRRSSGYLKRR